ncbi:hypothetical protein KAS08_00530 [Candidatus Pacearchaeota archaeon]|nr:hypothetical protein [Candidatus Pacearchaeota archaeon]
MEIKILKDEKDCLDIELNNLTIAEVLRSYLVKEDVKLAAWKRDNPYANPILHIEASDPKKALKAAIVALEKEVDSVVEDFKKLK